MNAKRNPGIGEVVIKCIDKRDHCNKKSNISVNITCFFSFCWHFSKIRIAGIEQYSFNIHCSLFICEQEV